LVRAVKHVGHAVFGIVPIGLGRGPGSRGSIARVIEGTCVARLRKPGYLFRQLRAFVGTLMGELEAQYEG